MSGRLLPAGHYGFGDLRAADYVQTAEATITAAMIDAFAALTGDSFAIHMTDKGARDKGFPARVAHGLLVLSVIDGLKNQAPAQFRAIASLGWDWRFRRPVFAGDRLSATLTLRSKRKTSNPGRGILRLAVVARNQHGETVQEGRNLLMVHR
ncbi:MaoC family dehydratase [Paracoccus pacificus]|uniref:MaoC family dehydratase n=1 Tax=Paracoccus pacificus TaxID=1463598 RepID=A0ABW4R1Y0_9RHOB